MTDRPRAVRVLAHAKTNLFLRILARESSGYHTLETLFTLLDLSDELSVEAAPSGIQLTVDGEDTGPPEQNLVTRAAEMVLSATGNRTGLRIGLKKNIPVRAGLGGGSSDGAAALKAVNALLGNPIPKHEILQLAARLGSDVPFFASGAPLALGWGRGERLFRLASLAPAAALLAVPPFGVSTPDAYQQLDAATRETARGAVILDPGALETWGSIARLGGNDFESVLFASEPRLRALFERMAETRPFLLRLSGSGSAIIALYKSTAERDQAASQLDPRQARLIPTLTRNQPPAQPA